MELAMFVWLASVLEQLGLVLMVVGIVSSVLALCVWGVRYVNYVDNLNSVYTKDNAIKPVGKPYVAVTCVGVMVLVLSTIIPSQKTMYLMAGAWVTQSVVQSETGDKVMKIVNGKLDEYLSEVEKSVKGVK